VHGSARHHELDERLQEPFTRAHGAGAATGTIYRSHIEHLFIGPPRPRESPNLDKSPPESNNELAGKTMLLPMSESSAARRRLSALFAASGLTLLVLLLVHPHEQMHGFSDLVAFEISHRLIDAFVHGGAIALFVLLLAGHVALARIINSASLPVTLAVTAFGAGCVFMTASLVLDGFVTPALALEHRAAQDLTQQNSIEALVRFCGTNIRVLMPMALLAFAASALAWCVPMIRAGGRSRLAGAVSGVIGAMVGAMMTAATPQIRDHTVIVSLVLIALWQLALVMAPWKASGTAEPLN
jgi:hypothetical protein